MFIDRDKGGDYDVDGEFHRGRDDAESDKHDPPSRTPVGALQDAIFGDNEDFEAAERAYEGGQKAGKD